MSISYPSDLQMEWARRIAESRGDNKVDVLIGTHGQVPIRDDGTFMPETVTWDPIAYPGTICGVNAGLMGLGNFMNDVNATQVARVIKNGPSINFDSDNAMVDFAESLKRVDETIRDMPKRGISYVSNVYDRHDVEVQVFPLLASQRPEIVNDLLRYSAFRYEPTGVNDIATNRVSLIDKTFGMNIDDERNNARKTRNEWHINIFYKDKRGKIKTRDIFPLLVTMGAPLSKNSRGRRMMAEQKKKRRVYTSTQNIVDALHAAGFLHICITDLSCEVFRQPLRTSGAWVLQGDHFSRILENMIGRYNLRLMKRGNVRKSHPGYAELTEDALQEFRILYEQMIASVRRRDSAAVDGPRSRIQLEKDITERQVQIASDLEMQRRRREIRSAAALKGAETKKRNILKRKRPSLSSMTTDSSSDSESDAGGGRRRLRQIRQNRRTRRSNK